MLLVCALEEKHTNKQVFYHQTHSLITISEAENIHIMREVASDLKSRNVIFHRKRLDSLVHLALKAFAPGRIPFPFQHRYNL